MQRLDVNDIRHELTKVGEEKKRLDAYENDLEDQLGRVMRDEVKPTPAAAPDPGPRQSFIDDTKDMHKSPEERALQTG